MENNIDQKFILSNQKSPDKTEQWFSDEIQIQIQTTMNPN
jgi:hypothetical protein